MLGHIRVMLADRHRLFREGLNLALSSQGDIDVVGQAATTPEAIDVIRNVRPDVALLNVILPEIDGAGLIPLIRRESPKTKSLVLIASRDETMIFEALKAGAKGYLSKDASISDLIKAIQTVHQGDVWVERRLIANYLNEDAFYDSQRKDLKGRTKEGLTAREHEVLVCLTKGTTNKEIGQALFISEKTVKTHLNNIFKKLNVTRRLQAILYALGLPLD